MPEVPGISEGALHDRLHTFSHGLKNRMTALWEVLRHTRPDTEDETAKELMAHAERAYFGAQRDLEQLLDDLHVDRAIRPAPPTRMLASELVRHAIERNVHRFQKKAQTVHVSPSEASVMTDAQWGTAILDALLSNASKFSPCGSAISVTIDSEQGQLAITVSDAGVGLRQEDLERVFVRYALLSSRPTDGEQQMRGTLGRCQQWAKALGGNLKAASSGQGKGTAFTLYLPKGS